MNDMKIDLVVCGQRPVADDSPEMTYGHAQLRSQWAHHQWHAVASPRGELPFLLPHALESGAHLHDDALVVLLAHGHWLMTDLTVERLLSAALHAAPLALCRGGAHQPAFPVPEYHTVRGLERYGELLARMLPTEELEISTLPDVPVAVARLGALRALSRGAVLRAVWAGGCFAHDFGNYQQGGRPEVVRLIPPSTRRILDVGGGEGFFLQSLRATLDCETHLSEFSTQACARAQARVDHTWPGDFLEQQWRGLPHGGQGAFDCITILDALEHTEHPRRWLERFHHLLTPGGCVVGSVPNVGHWSVVADLLEGRWDYCPVGIHCLTHLRFFTRRTLQTLLHDCGFIVEHMESVVIPCPADWRNLWLSSPDLQTSMAELDTHAFLFRARPA